MNIKEEEKKKLKAAGIEYKFQYHGIKGLYPDVCVTCTYTSYVCVTEGWETWLWLRYKTIKAHRADEIKAN